MGREVACIAEHQSYDRIVARCELTGRSLGDLLRTDGGHEGGRGFSGVSAFPDVESSGKPTFGSLRLGEQQGSWMLPVAGLSAAAAVGVLYIGLKTPARGSRRAARRGGQAWRRR